ncbi:hypothetical protein JTB14_031129 [Gonioctena quinquepunctata]|nr:hypothetical protein JTB14_031129 [Gonioctena quinquepunctata]
MSHCMVLWCENKGQIPGITYFKLTKSRHDAWMEALGRNPNIEHLSCSNVVCSEHFTEENKIYTNKCIRLKSDAVPSLKLKKRDVLVENKGYLNRAPDQMPGVSKQLVNIILEEEHENLGEQSSSSSEYYLMENKENYPNIPVSSTPVIEICTQKSNGSPGSSITMTSVPASPIIQRFKRKLETSSSDSSSSKGVTKKLRKDIRLMHNYSSSQKKKLRQLKVKKIQKRLRANRSKTKRLKKKISNMGQIISDLRKRKLVSENALDVLEISCSKVSVSIMRKALRNAETLKKGKKLPRDKIPEEIRSFALTLQFYSSKAYTYVRNTFDLALPSLSTMRSWMSNVHCEPGYCENSFRSLSVIAEKANIVREGLKKLHEVGITVTSVTCDGPSAHFTMAKHLGGEVYDIVNLKPYFEHPITKSKVFIIFDACHMLKLVRNNWARCRVFVNSKGESIDYKYIEMLHRIQEEEKCSLGNRLRKGHIEWRRQKMKVNLAAQTLSSSVADALEFLMSDVDWCQKICWKYKQKLIRHRRWSITIPDDNPVYDEILRIINKKTVSGLHNQCDDDVENEEQILPEIYSNIEFVVDELSLEESEQELPQECTT